MALPESRTGEEFLLQAEFHDGEIPLGGLVTPLGKMSLRFYLDADSTRGLARAGLNDLFAGGAGGIGTPDGHARMNKIWNAAIEMNGSGEISVKRMGRDPESQPYLQPGATQNLRLALQKSGAKIVLQASYSTPGLLELVTSADLVMNEAVGERGFAPWDGPIGVPVSIAAMSASLSDHGAVGMIEEFGNASFGEMVSFIMAAGLDSQEISAVNRWIDGALDGATASFRANALEPLWLHDLIRLFNDDPGKLVDLVEFETGGR